jgi:uncharacterized membrane protein YqgA involved in biofilm formation
MVDLLEVLVVDQVSTVLQQQVVLAQQIKVVLVEAMSLAETSLRVAVAVQVRQVRMVVVHLVLVAQVSHHQLLAHL